MGRRAQAMGSPNPRDRERGLRVPAPPAPAKPGTGPQGAGCAAPLHKPSHPALRPRREAGSGRVEHSAPPRPPTPNQVDTKQRVRGAGDPGGGTSRVHNPHHHHPDGSKGAGRVGRLPRPQSTRPGAGAQGAVASCTREAEHGAAESCVWHPSHTPPSAHHEGRELTRGARCASPPTPNHEAGSRSGRGAHLPVHDTRNAPPPVSGSEGTGRAGRLLHTNAPQHHPRGREPAAWSCTPHTRPTTTRARS
jgi:hypothetical protein